MSDVHDQPGIQTDSHGDRSGILTPARPKGPERASSSEAIIKSAAQFRQDSVSKASEPASDTAPKPVPAAPAIKKPEAKPSGSLRLLTDLKRTLSSNNLRHTASKDKTASIASTTATSDNGKGKSKLSDDSTPQTPELRSLFQNGKLCPDLDAINRALESLKLTSPEDPYVSNLTRLAAGLKSARMDSRKALLDAMKQRDRGNPEICRALCLSIVQAEHSDLDTKVYAYNILSTQASPGQCLNYLASAWDLVKQHEGKREDCGKLLGVIAMLKENAIAKDGKPPVSGSRLDFGCEKDLLDIEKVPTIPREIESGPAMVKDLLKLPLPKSKGAGSGTISPRTEKIFDWAGVERN